MVVVAIIAALIAILLPSLNKAMAVSHIAVCGSNLKQMNFGYMTYHIENRFASYNYPGNGNASYDHFWMGKIAKYVGNIDDIRLCPSASDTRGTDVFGTATTMWSGENHPAGYWIHRNEDKDNDGHSDFWYGSYGMNAWMYNSWSAAESYNRNYRDPGPGIPVSNAPALLDSAWVDLWPRTNDVAAADLLDPFNGGNWSSGMVRSTIDRHLMGVNVALMDGHVEHTPLGKLWWLNWSKTFQPGVGEPAL